MSRCFAFLTVAFALSPETNALDIISVASTDSDCTTTCEDQELSAITQQDCTWDNINNFDSSIEFFWYTDPSTDTTAFYNQEPDPVELNSFTITQEDSGTTFPKGCTFRGIIFTFNADPNGGTVDPDANCFCTSSYVTSDPCEDCEPSCTDPEKFINNQCCGCDDD